MPKISLRKNFSYVFLSNLLVSFCMWIMLVILAKMSGTAEPVGIYGIAQAISLPVSMFFSMRLKTVQVTDARNEFMFSDYYSFKIITSILMIIVIILIGYIFYEGITVWVICILGMSYAVMNLREVFLGAMQKAERMGLMSISRILQSILSLLLFTVLFFYFKSLVLSIGGLTIARGMVLLFYDIPVAKIIIRKDENEINFFHGFKRGKILKLLKITCPLGIVAWLNTLLVSIPRLVLKKFYSIEEVGYFVAISTLLVAGNILTLALGQSVSPRLAKYYVNNIGAYKKLVLKFAFLSMLIGCAGIVAAILIGRFVLTVMFKADYAEHSNVLVYLMIAGCAMWMFSCMSASLNATRSFAIQIPVYAFCVFVCLISTFLMIPKLGMIGAACSIFAGNFAGFLGCFVFVIVAIKKCESFR